MGALGDDPLKLSVADRPNSAAPSSGRQGHHPPNSRLACSCDSGASSQLSVPSVARRRTKRHVVQVNPSSGTMSGLESPGNLATSLLSLRTNVSAVQAQVGHAEPIDGTADGAAGIVWSYLGVAGFHRILPRRSFPIPFSKPSISRGVQNADKEEPAC